MRSKLFFKRSFVSTVVLALALGGCYFTGDTIQPSISDDGIDQAVASDPIVARSGEMGSASDANALPLMGTSFFEAPGVTPGQSTGTSVGERIQRLRTDLSRLQARLVNHNETLQKQRGAARRSAEDYQKTIAAINARLQVGTTPGNPVMVQQWNTAQQELESIGASISDLNSLGSEASNTAALSAYVLDSSRATYELRGALEEDHRQLAILEDEANQTVVILDRLQNELTEDIIRAQNFFSNERNNLTALQIAVDNGEIIGGSLGNRVFGLPVPPSPNGASGLVGRQTPLAIIRFDQPTVNYEQALFTTINQVLERRPSSAFDVVTVAPVLGTVGDTALSTSRARRYGESVMRSLANLGLPASRLSLSSTSNLGASVPEVHVYLR